MLGVLLFLGNPTTFFLGVLGLVSSPAAAGETPIQETILVLRPNVQAASGANAAAAFEQCYKGLTEELGSDFKAVSFFIDGDTKVAELVVSVNNYHPRLIVLMDAKSINLFRRFRRVARGPAHEVPGLVLMAVFLENQLTNMTNIAGIQYEIQGLTCLGYLRTLFGETINRVGIIYRPALENFFNRQVNQCKREELELVGYRLKPEGKPLARQIRNGLKHLIRKEKVDAIWVLNDSVILTGFLLAKAWYPLLSYTKVPVVVGLERFVSDLPVGHFAVVPDHYSLGIQASQMIYEIRDNHWKLDGFDRLTSPISVQKVLNLGRLHPKIRKHLNVDTLGELDEVIQ